MFGGAAVYPRTGTTAGTILISSFLFAAAYPPDGFVAFGAFSVVTGLLTAEAATMAGAATVAPLNDLLSVVD